MIQIRAATKSDARVLTELGRFTFTETFAKDNCQEDMDLYVSMAFNEQKQIEEIEDPGRHIEIAWIEDRPAGSFHLVNSPPEPCVKGPRPVELLRLYVDSRWQRSGVGSALMNRLLQAADELGFQTIWLGVWEHNFKAQAFYNKFNFSQVGHHIFQLGRDDQIDLIMTRAVVMS